jgi:hypothetical protein
MLVDCARGDDSPAKTGEIGVPMALDANRAPAVISRLRALFTSRDTASLKSLAMPADEGLGLDNHQCLSPAEESGPQQQRKARSGGELARWNSVFPVESKLLAEEQYFGTQGSSGRKRQSQEMNALGDCSNKDKQRSEQLRGLEHVYLGLTASSLWLGTESLHQRSLGKLHLFM